MQNVNNSILLSYRSDIDGLRALAVISVILFHIDIPGLSGGFLGVDIFFVISGFLITSIILKDIHKGDFSVARFYERRIKRIFPALFPVIFFTIVVGVYLFDTNSLKDFGKSITATSLFASNIQFWLESGYFATSSMKKPLLHTWSLAVEEQFYIFFPLILVFINRYLKNRFFGILLTVAITSFFLNIYGALHYPSSTFYFLHSRAWELLVGSILALGVLPKPSLIITRNILSLLGISLIVYGICFYSEYPIFSLLQMISVVFGAGLIIHSGNSGTSIINNIISFPPLVFIGLISYSLYLWHWPIVSFGRYLIFRPFTLLESIAILMSSLIIAALSWKYIELPFRHKSHLFQNKKTFFAFSGVLIIITAITGGLITYINTDLIWHRSGKWEKISENIINGSIPPIVGNGKIKPSFILWGDSHAMALIPVIESEAKRNNISGFIVTHTGTAPLLDNENDHNKNINSFDKSRYNRSVLNFIHNHTNIKTVILSGRWAWHATGFENRKENPSQRYTKDKYIEYEKRASILKSGLSNTVHTLLSMKRKVIIVSDVPEIRYDVPRFYMLNLRLPSVYNNYDIRPTIIEYNDREKNVQKILFELAMLPNVVLIHPESIMFSQDGKAKILDDGNLLYRDDNHLSTFGAYYLTPIFKDVFLQMTLND